MQKIADFHIHSKYSRACSKNLELAQIEKTCRIKGVDIIATGDFTFPNWFESIKEELEEVENKGLYKLKESDDEKVLFTINTELALIYKKNDKCRRVHIMVHAPNIESALKLNKYLDKNYNIRSDGRPILGMSCEDLVKLCLSIHPKFLIYPAHIWTPWFAVFGSKSGFDSMEECFGDYTDHIYAYETGLSSDPEMNWRLSALDSLTLLSSSDAHSLPNIGREANIFDLDDASYDEIYEMIKTKDLKKLKYTIEFYPEEGMYHYDGHRSCGVCFSPAETKKHKGICPKCGKSLIIGVENRVDELADREIGFKPKKSQKFKRLVELDKIIAEVVGVKSRKSKKVVKIYDQLINDLGTELDILLNISLDKIKEVGIDQIAEGIRRVRSEELRISPGFDGQYGKVQIFGDD